MSDIFKLEERNHSWQEPYPEGAEGSDCRPDFQCEEILTVLGARERENLLDLGCSRYPLLAAAVRRGLNATGLEYSPEAAAFSQKSAPQAVVVLGAAPGIPFEAGTFDLVTCLELPAQLRHPAPQLAEVYRVLKSGGRACLLLPNSHCRRALETQSGSEPEHSPAFSREEWEKMLWNEGLPAYKIKQHFKQADLPQIETRPWSGRFGRFCRKRLGDWLPAIFTPTFAFFCKKI
jgi:SAM-dependent methyltransferase